VSTHDRSPRPIPALTGLRFVAASWVVLYHFRLDLAALLPATRVALPVFERGWLGVDLFFVLSGFVIAHNYAGRVRTFADYRRFLGLRLARIYPLHLATLLVVALLLSAQHALGHSGSGNGPSSQPGVFSGSSLVANLLLIHAWGRSIPSWNLPSWSISAEWFAYLCFPLVAAMTLRVRRRGTAAATAALSLGAMFVAMSSAHLAGTSHWDWLLRVAGEFTAGALLHRVWLMRPAAPRRSWDTALVAIGCAAVLGCVVLPGGPSSAYWLVPLLAVTVLAAASATGPVGRLLSTRGMVFWGEASYGLYMTHVLVQLITQRVVGPTTFRSASLPVRLGVVTTWAVAVGVAAVAAYVVVERPARRRLRKVIDAPRRVARAARPSYADFRALHHFTPLDGLRAISIMLVVSLHTTDRLWRPLHGAVGVTVFFVISGFLITTLLLREEDGRGEARIGAFYIRRAFRILPLYYLTLAAYVLLIGILHLQAGAADLWRSIGYYLTYQNDFAPVGSGFAHTWSLAIEEKFYLLWPLVFAVLALRRRRTSVAVALTVLSAAAALWEPVHYFATYTPILLGCVLAIAMHSERGYAVVVRLTRGWVAAVLLCALGVQMVLFENGTSIHVVFGLLVALAFPSFLLGPKWLSRVLSSRIAVYIGERSYAIYLIHRIAKGVVDRAIAPGSHSVAAEVARFVLIMVVALLGAEVLRRLVEQPMIRLGRRLAQRTGEARGRQRVSVSGRVPVQTGDTYPVGAVAPAIPVPSTDA
jgi:peptidoglycan/LPS O-acetylase OafA/YrhL